MEVRDIEKKKRGLSGIYEHIRVMDKRQAQGVKARKEKEMANRNAVIGSWGFDFGTMVSNTIELAIEKVYVEEALDKAAAEGNTEAASQVIPQVQLNPETSKSTNAAGRAEVVNSERYL